MAKKVKRTGTKAEALSDVPAEVRRSVEEAIAGSYGSRQESQLYIVTIHGPSHTSDWNRYVVHDAAGTRIAGSGESMDYGAYSPLLQSRSAACPGEVDTDLDAESQLAIALDSVRHFRAILDDTSAALDRMSGKAHEISATYRAERTI